MSTTKHYLTIGDLHGRNAWLPAAPTWCSQSPDHIVVFLGDYVDSFDLPLGVQESNLKQVLVLYEAFPGQVILLLGNHDAHYLWQDAPRGSGFNVAAHATLFPLFNENAAKFQVAYQHETPDGRHHLWTHAGVSRAWLESVPPFGIAGAAAEQALTLAEALNYMAEAGQLRRDLLNVGSERGGHGPGGPLWAGIGELRAPITGYYQIIGHTAQEAAGPYPVYANPDDLHTSVILCDYNAHAPEGEPVGVDFFYQLSLEV